MHSPIARYFENLRTRFPTESALLITDSQQSFEAIEAMPQSERPKGARCAYIEASGIACVVWEMDETGDEFCVFGTPYVLFIGRFRLSQKPSGTTIVAGFYIDLGEIADSIEKHFHATDKFAAEAGSGNKRKLALFGFCESYGHHFWNEVGGLAAALETGTFGSLDGVIVGPYDYFNLGPALQAKGKRVWKLGQTGTLVTPDHLMLYNCNVVTEEARRLVIDNAHLIGAPAQLPPAPLSMCFQVRRHRRPWVDEENKLASIIETCECEWPGTLFVFDGHSTSPGIANRKGAEINGEIEMVRRLSDRLSHINIQSSIGMDVNAKINVLKHVDIFVGPIGSGGVLSSWILRKPTVTYGPTNFYPMMERQEKTVPEGGPMVYAVPKEHIRDVHELGSPFDVDAEQVMHQIRQAVADHRAGQTPATVASR